MAMALKLKTWDNQIFEVEQHVAVQSISIKNMIDDGYSEDVIPLPNVDGKTLAMVLDWCKTHLDKDVDMPKLKKYEADFLDVDEAVLYSLLMAAHYLEIKDLLEQCYQKVANMIKGKTTQELRTTFKIENDFTPEEEREIREKNPWAFARENC